MNKMVRAILVHVVLIWTTAVSSAVGTPPDIGSQKSSVKASTVPTKNKGIKKLRDFVTARTTRNAPFEEQTSSLLSSSTSPSSLSAPEIKSLHLRPRIVSLNIMVAGLSGLGKTTMCAKLLESLVETDTSTDRRQKMTSSSAATMTRSTVVIDESRQFETYDPKANTILRVRIIDTPGFGNRIDHKHSVRPITEYVERRRHDKYRKETSAAASVRDYMDSTEDQLVHVCLYFLGPGRFLEIDRHFLRRIRRDVPTVVPVIAKADTLTDEEIGSYRAELCDIFKREDIRIYNFDDLDLASTSTYNSDKSKSTSFDRGRRPGEVLAIISRDGIYPWGKSYSFDRKHSDLQLIRDLLLSQHTERFVESALVKYTEYRSRRITRTKLIDAFKFTVLIGFVALRMTGYSFICGDLGRSWIAYLKGLVNSEQE